MSLLKQGKIIIKKGKYTDENLKKYYNPKFELHEFQKHSYNATEIGDNQFVTSHTGSGKSACGINAIVKSINNGKQAHYIVPIKALANQKYEEFVEIFGNDNVAIITGEKQINPSALVVIIIAECFMNAIQRKSDKSIYSYNFNQEDIGCIVIDEAHSMNLNERGHVWENLIIQLDPRIEIVALSATVNGVEDVCEWICKLKEKNCQLISTEKRPVPLIWSVYDNKKIHKILDDKEWIRGKWTDIMKNIKDRKKIQKIKNPNPKRVKHLTKVYQSIKECLKILKKKNMLPVNIFVLNKNHIEIYGKKLKEDFNLTTDEEKKEINNLWKKYLSSYKASYQDKIQWCLIEPIVSNGIGIHHAGIVPILKDFIEILYSKKLLKICVATETFAMGVSFPTRTSLIVGTTKHDGKTRRNFKTDEIIQMGGRAGRSIDSNGDCIIILDQDVNMSEGEIKKVLLSPPEKLTSKFKFDYSFILTKLRQRIENESSVPVKKYLENEVKKTFFYHQEEKKIEGLKKQHKQLLNQDNELFTEDVKKCYQLTNEINDLENSKYISGIQVSMKKQRKINKKIKKLEEKLNLEMANDVNIEKNLKKYSDKQSNLSLMTFQIDGFNRNIKVQIDILLNFLKKNKLLDEDNLTTLGYIVSEISDCNPIVLAYIIENKYLDKLEFSEIVALLSIFINDGSINTEDEPNLSEFVERNSISGDFYDILIQISEFTEHFGFSESQLNSNNKLELPYPINSNWQLHLKLFESVKLWTEGRTWNESISSYKKMFCSRFNRFNRTNGPNANNIPSSFEGNFIKNILRLSNIVRSVESITKIINNHTVAMKLDGFQEKMLRDEVTTDSLYIFTSV